MKIIKKITLIIPILMIAIVLIPSTFAAGFSFSPTSGTYDKGQTYRVSIYVNPASDTVYTAKAEIKYPANLLEVRSFSFGSGWTALNQPGYDQINNSSGVLIKTGGFTAGLKNRTLLGTITFYAKSSGSADVSVGSGSLILDVDSKDTLNSYPSASFTLSDKIEPVSIPAVINQAGEAPGQAGEILDSTIDTSEDTKDAQATSVEEDATSVEEDDSIVLVEFSRTNFAAIALAFGWDKFASSFLLILLTILAFMGIVAFTTRKKWLNLKKRKRNETDK